MDKAATLYRDQMREVLRRFHAIERVLRAKKPRTTELDFDNEFLWIQIRKIVELVTFGGITADEDRYAALRAETTANPDYTDDWKVSKILPRLEKITENFLPIPVGDPQRVGAGHFHYDHAGEVETRERFVEIYDRAGYYLHVHNPFSPVKTAEFDAAVRASRDRLKIDRDYLWGILRKHAKVGLEFDKSTHRPTDAANAKLVWLVELGKPAPDSVHMMIAEGVSEDGEKS